MSRGGHTRFSIRPVRQFLDVKFDVTEERQITSISPSGQMRNVYSPLSGRSFSEVFVKFETLSLSQGELEIVFTSKLGTVWEQHKQVKMKCAHSWS